MPRSTRTDTLFPYTPPVRSAFATQLASYGGSVVQTLAVVSDEPADMTPLLQSVATREGGIDAVFIALRGDQARAIAPQLAAAGLSYKPRVATSQLLSGTGNAEEDRVLDGIKFPTERGGGEEERRGGKEGVR